MAKIALLLDEDVRRILADILRQRTYDAVHVIEVGRGGRSDLEQLEYAVSQRRAILSHNIRDYRLLHELYREQGKDHSGIIVSNQLPLRELLRRVLRCLSQRTAAEVENRLLWLHDFK